MFQFIKVRLNIPNQKLMLIYYKGLLKLLID